MVAPSDDENEPGMLRTRSVKKNVEDRIPVPSSTPKPSVKSQPALLNTTKAKASVADPGSDPASSTQVLEDGVPLQLRQIKKNWDVTTVSRGYVLDKIKVFGGGDPGTNKHMLHPLENTGRTNPALKRRREMERQQELERQRLLEEQRKKAGGKYGFGRTQQAKNRAAAAIQSVARMKAAKRLAERKREQVAARAAALAREEANRKILERITKAAIAIQAVMRSSLTRIRVGRMVEEMIMDLEAKEKSQEQLLQEMEAAAAAIQRAKLDKIREEEERLRVQQEKEAARRKEIQEKERAAEEARLRQQQEEEERLAQGAIARQLREASAEDLELSDAAAEAELQRQARIEQQEETKKQNEMERDRRNKNTSLFCGPLPWGVALLPDWWLAQAPYYTLQLDTISEDPNGEDFEEWRNGNITFPTY